MVIKTEIISPALASVYSVQYNTVVPPRGSDHTLRSEKQRQNSAHTNGALNQHLL